jgi:hypothetical protein
MIPLPLLLATTPTTAPAAAAPTVLVANAETANTSQQPSNKPENKWSYPYASIQAGLGFSSGLNGNVNVAGGIANVQNTLGLNTGFNGELAVGYKFPKFRTDLSVGYTNLGNQTQTVTAPNFASGTVTGTGSVNLFTVMANLYYDFKIKKKDGDLSRWSPYIGAGIGWGNLSTPNCALANNCNLYEAGSASTFAYQGKIGVAYRATQTGFVFLEGGYLGTTSANVQNVSYDPLGIWRVNLGWRQRF